MKQPYVVCAAIHLNDEHARGIGPANIDRGIVLMGLRHGDCIAQAIMLRLPGVAGARRGFITSDNKFVDRATAYQIALEARQIAPSNTETLISEDLY